MTPYEVAATIIAGLALLISLIAVFVSGKANNLNKKMFKRQGVIDLFMAWQGVTEVNSQKLIGPDVIRAANALALTASLWNHDIIEKVILYQTYWAPYKESYDTLIKIDKLVPGLKRTCKSLLTSEIAKAYKGMQDFDLSKVDQTKL